MHRDQLKAIKQFFYQFQSLHQFKLTQKSLSDGYIFMQFLSLVDCQHFDTRQLTKPSSQTQKQYEHMSVFIKPPGDAPSKEMDLVNKMKNWKTVIRRIKEYFSERLQKGIKYGDVDLVDLSKNSTVEEITKMFELVLCVVANCEDKDEFIGKMMDLEESTQVILAGMMQTALETRVCSLEDQERMELIEELQLKEQQLSSLYSQVSRLQQLNSEYAQKLQQYQKSAGQLEYQKQKLRRFNKKNSLIVQSNNGSSSFLCGEDSYFLQPSEQSQYVMEESVSYSRGTHKHIVESLKNKLIRQQEQHENQVEQLHQQIDDLQEQLKEKSHFEELLVIYQEKYQEALAYVEKVTLYEKEKNKIYQEIIEKDIIIEELKVTIAESNERLVEIEEEKIDLQLLLAKKNNQRLNKKNCCSNCKTNITDSAKPQQPADQKQPLYKTHLRTLKKHQTVMQPLFTPTHNRQSSQQVPRSHSRIHLSLYPYHHDDQDLGNSRLDELQIKTESQSLQIKRLQRKEKELAKHNAELKAKLQKMRKIQNENKKLSNIIVELHTRKNQQTEILVSCLHETFVEYDFKFHKLIGDNYLNSHADPVIKKQPQEKQKFTQLSNLPSKAYRMSAFGATFSSQKSPYKKNNNSSRNPSIMVQSQASSEKEMEETSLNKEENSLPTQ